MTTSTVFGLPYLASQQATPEITHNEALYMIEAMLRGVKAIQNAPPGGPADGDTYIVGTAGSGAWLNKNNCVAIYMSNAWRFIPGFDTLGAQIAMGAAQEGMTLWNIALDARYTWTGAAWAVASASIADNSVTLAKLINATAQGDFIGRNTAGAGAWEDMTSAQAKTRLAITGADVANTPAGGIAATTVQTAINELDTEKVAKAGDTMTGPLIINAGSNFGVTNAGLVVRSDDAGANGPFVVRYHNSASPAVADTLSSDAYYGKNSAAADILYANLLVQVTNVTAGAEAATFTYYTSVAGTRIARATIAAGFYMIGSTGLDQGVGTINAVNYFDDGVNINTLYVGLTGTQTIAGPKTFSSRIIISGAGSSNNAEIDITNTDASGGTWRIGDGLAAANGTFTIFDGVAGALRFQIAPTTGNVSFRSLVLGVATGGDQGAGRANVERYYANGNLVVDDNGLLRTRTFTVATLAAAAGLTGALCRVSDSLAAPVYNGVAAGGGTTFAQVTSDGTNWRYC